MYDTEWYIEVSGGGVSVLPRIGPSDWNLTKGEIEMVDKAEAGSSARTPKETVDCISDDLTELMVQVAQARANKKLWEDYLKEREAELNEAMKDWREAYPQAQFNFGGIVANPVEGSTVVVSVKALIANGVDPEIIKKCSTRHPYVWWADVKPKTA